MKRITLLLFLLVIVFYSCKNNAIRNVQNTVSATKEKYIEDSRLTYWNINVVENESRIQVLGSTSSEEGFNELKATFSEDTNIEFEVELLPSENLEGQTWAIVNLSVCNIRKHGDHSAELVSQALCGTPVKVFKKQDGWFLIQTPDHYFGWVDKTGISLKTAEELAIWKEYKKVLFNKQFGFAYQEVNKNGAVECDLILADLLSITKEVGKYYQVVFPDGRKAFVLKDECISLECWNKENFKLDNVIASAMNFKGIPYLWGGASSKMTDCSGFTKTAYYKNGVLLQRDALQQTLYGELVETENDYSELQAGDLLFFGRKATADKKERVTHVGLYIGNTEFIHASGKVRINSLDRTRENYDKYYEEAFVRARRINGQVGSKGIEWVVDNEFYKEILPE